MQLELGFDQRENHTIWSYQLESARQDQTQRDEGDIDHAKIDKLRNVLTREKPRIQLLQHNNTRIVPDFPCQLAVADIHRVHFGGAALQKTIGESASRCADVQRNLIANTNIETIESAFQFQCASTGIARSLRDRNFCIGRDQVGGFRNCMVPCSHFARHDRAPRTLAAVEKASGDQEIVDPDFFCH